MPDSPVSPSLDLQLVWRGTFGRVRVFPDRIDAETDYERDARTRIPMDAVRGWRIEPCDFDAVCVEFVTEQETFRVLLDTADEKVAGLALRRALGTPLPPAS